MAFAHVVGAMPSLVRVMSSIFTSSPDARQTCTQSSEGDVVSLAWPANLLRTSEHSMIKSASHIPIEVILNILEFAYYDDNLEPNAQLLADCARVCKAWSFPSQKLLFRHVTLRSHQAFTSFSYAVNCGTERGQALGDTVARLRVTLDPNHPDQLSHRAFAHAIHLCPNLYELDISVYGRGVSGQQDASAAGVDRMSRVAASFDAGTLALLRAGPRIQSLKIANWSDNDRLAFQLLSDVWPSVTAVALKGLPPCLPAGDVPAPFHGNLSEVRMNFQALPKLDFVKWLLHNSSQSLRGLELEREPSPEFIDYLVREHGSTLESLSIPSCATPDQASSVQKCERLKELKLEGPAASPLLFGKLPDGLEHLAFGIDKDTPLHVITAFVKRQVNLKAITAHIWDGGNKHPQLPNLRIACAWKGVEFISASNVQRFRTLVRGDPIPIVSFPRVKEPANLCAMLSISRASGRSGATHHRSFSESDADTLRTSDVENVSTREVSSVLAALNLDIDENADLPKLLHAAELVTSYVKTLV